MNNKVLSCIAYSLYLVNKYAERLWCAIKSAIPSCVYIGCFEHLLSPAVEDAEVVKADDAFFIYFECCVSACTRSEGIR